MVAALGESLHPIKPLIARIFGEIRPCTIALAVDNIEFPFDNRRPKNSCMVVEMTWTRSLLVNCYASV